MLLMEYARIGCRSDAREMRRFYRALGCAEARDALGGTAQLQINVGGMTQLRFYYLPPLPPPPPPPDYGPPLPYDEVPAHYMDRHTPGPCYHPRGYGHWRGNFVIGYESLEDLNAAKLEVSRLGCDVEPHIMTFDARRATVRDPDGNEVNLVVLSDDTMKYLGNHFGIRPGAPRLGGGYAVGIVNFVIEVPIGTSQRIAQFYSEVLGCRVKSSRRYDTQAVHAKVVGGPGGNSQGITFVETEAPQKFEGNYLCLYVDNFKEVAKRLLALKLCWRDFGNMFHRAGVSELGASVRDHAVMIREIVDVDTRRQLLELHHEIRAATHPDACVVTGGWDKPRIRRTNFDPDPRYKHLKPGGHRFGP